MTDTRTALLDSAETAARARGFDGFSYADLSADVGIRKASIHHHFPTKAALATAMIARYHDRFEGLCHDIDAQHPTGGARLLALIHTYREALEGGRSLCLCVAFSVSRDRLPKDVPQALGRFRAMMTNRIAATFARGAKDGSITQGGDPQAEARAALALLEGAHLAARAVQDVAQFDAALGVLRARITA